MQSLKTTLFNTGLALLLAVPSLASANTTTLSTDPAYAGSFVFYCEPYHHAFTEGFHYMPGSGGGCAFSLPSTITGRKIINIYKGVPGNATLVAGDLVVGFGTLEQEDSVNFGTPAQDDQYFAAEYDYDTIPGMGAYLASGGTLPVGAVANQNYYIRTWKWGYKLPAEYTPVVVIPGILGSWQQDGVWVMDPVLHTYDNLTDTLKANGYVDGKTLFTLPYDWEQSNVVTTGLLKQKIADIKNICGCSLVDIVAHSMGGLVATNYVEQPDYKDDVDHLFLVATPLFGAPLAYPTWEAGKVDFDNPLFNTVMQRIFANEARGAGYKTVFDYIRGKPVVSVQELLPTMSDYLLVGTNTLYYPTGYPTNPFLEQLLQTLGQKWFPASLTLRVITADNGTNKTTNAFTIASSTTPGLWPDGEPTKTWFDAGDGTVPTNPLEQILPVDKKYLKTDHLGIVSTSSVYIFKEMVGKNPDTVINKQYSPLANSNWHILFVKLFSPIDMQIVAPDGKRLGKDFVTNTEVNEIPNAFYSGFATDNEYAIILNPLPGTYKVNTVGTGAGGHYTIVTDYTDATSTSESSTEGTTTPGQVISNTLVVSATSTTATITPPIVDPVLTPTTCASDIAVAYQKKWIGKKAVYDGLTFDCKALAPLLQTRNTIQATPTSNRTKKDSATLSLTVAAIQLVLANMDLLAKDAGNTTDAVQLITKYTTWFRNH